MMTIDRWMHAGRRHCRLQVQIIRSACEAVTLAHVYASLEVMPVKHVRPVDGVMALSVAHTICVDVETYSSLVEKLSEWWQDQVKGSNIDTSSR